MSCDIDDCDGYWHSCPDCAGEGFVEDDWQDGGPVDETTCRASLGEGGWPCSDPLDATVARALQTLREAQ